MAEAFPQCSFLLPSWGPKDGRDPWLAPGGGSARSGETDEGAFRGSPPSPVCSGSSNLRIHLLPQRGEGRSLADAFHASVIDANVGHFIFEITCKPSKIDQFIAIMGPLGLIEVCRTGIAVLNRGEAGCEGVDDPFRFGTVLLNE